MKGKLKLAEVDLQSGTPGQKSDFMESWLEFTVLKHPDFSADPHNLLHRDDFRSISSNFRSGPGCSIRATAARDTGVQDSA